MIKIKVPRYPIPDAKVCLVIPWVLLCLDIGFSLQTKANITTTLDSRNELVAHFCPWSCLLCLSFALAGFCCNAWEFTFLFPPNMANIHNNVLASTNYNLLEAQKERLI